MCDQVLAPDGTRQDCLGGLLELAAQLWSTADEDSALEQILDKAIALSGADRGNVQLLDDRGVALRIRAQRGFSHEFLQTFATVSADDSSVCAQALRTGQQVSVEDVQTDARFAALRPATSQAGIRAVQSTPLKDSDGHVLGVISTHFQAPHRFSSHELVVLDLCARLAEAFLQRRRSTAELRAQADTLRQALSAAHAGTWSLDLREETLFWDPDARAILGITGEGRESLTEGLARLSTSGLDQVRARLEKLREPAPGDQFDETLELRRRDGLPLWVQVEGRVTRTGGGIPAVLHGILRDVTRRVRTESELATVQSKLQAALESMTDAVFISDAEGRFVDFNQAFATFHRFPSKAACARTLREYPVFLDVYLPDGQLATLDQWAVPRALRGETVTNAEYTLHRKDTGETWVGSYSFAPIRDERGAIVGSVTVGRDITEEKRLREELLQAQKLEVVGRLASGIAHDFNNLLMGIQVCARNACTSQDTAEQRAALEEVQRAATRGVGLTRQLLSFCRKPPPAPGAIEVDEVLRANSDLWAHLLGEDLQLTFELAGEGLRVLAHESRIEQMVGNLLVNARDAMRDGGEIRVSTRRVDGRIEIAVTDTGSGIPPEVRARIFDPFFTTKPALQGTGLGLSSVKYNVEQLDGEIDFETETGKGTTFRIRLPVVSPIAIALEPAPAEAVQDLPATSLLLVEDERLLRVAMQHSLRTLGHEVLTAASGKEALERAAGGGSFEFLVTDVTLPDTYGPELARELRRSRPGLGVIYVSAHSKEHLVSQGRLTSTDHFLEKPFEVEALSQLLGRLARTRGNVRSQTPSRSQPASLADAPGGKLCADALPRSEPGQPRECVGGSPAA